MRKIQIFIMLILCIFVIGCDSNQLNDFTIVATIFPHYDIVKAIVKDKANVKLAIDPGVDSHNYDPSVQGILDIKKADLFIYTGEFMEKWATDLKTDPNSYLNLSQIKDIHLEEIHNKDHQHEDIEHSHAHLIDPHIWTSPNNLLLMVDAICQKVISLDESNKDFYLSNALAYKTEIFKIIDDLAVFLDNIISDKYLSKLQEFLLSGAIFTEASKVLAIIIIFILASETTLTVTLLILNLPVSLLILPFFIIPMLFTYVVVQQERRAQEIERTAPDFLRQLSSMLQVGLSFENAMEDMSQYGEGPMYDEMRRTIIEIRMGRNFDDAWAAMSRRLKSRELERIFSIILDGRKSGSSISKVLSDVSDDLRDLMALKRERRSSVMMSVMFLLISAVIATPFAVGMVSVYSGFMQSYGMDSAIIFTAPLAGEFYLIIHSILVGFIISIIMDGEIKKGVKYSLPLVAGSFGIFYFISTFGGSLLVGGF